MAITRLRPRTTPSARSTPFSRNLQ
jgi:hypothetical protein